MDNDLQITNGDVTGEENFPNLERLTQSYLSLKQKICGTHDLIKQYNDKLKECERLKSDLDTANKQARKMTCNFNSTLAKVIKLELQNTEYKKNIESLTTKVNEHEIKMAADQQHIQQLVCKIKDVEEQRNEKIMEYNLEKSSLQVKVKELEQELKVAKKSYDTKVKKMEKKIPLGSCNNKSNKITEEVKATSDIGVNTTFSEDKPKEEKPKPEVAEKCVMTTEFYTLKDDVYPIFCAKCEALLDPPPLEKICQMMSADCPPMIEKISSPPKKPDTSNEQCKPQISPIISEMPSTKYHEQNLNNSSAFTSPKFSATRDFSILDESTSNVGVTSIPSQTAEVTNQNNSHIDNITQTPVPLSTPNSKQCNRCVDISAITPSLSIVETLQNRVNTLEMKVKKRLSKRKFMEKSNCWQHKHPCYVPDINGSLQANLTFELWKRMSEFYDKQETRQYDFYKKYVDAKISKLKLKRLKLKVKKRLQSACTNTWRVESLPVKFEQSPLRNRSKKRKHRHIILHNKSDYLSNSTEDLEKCGSDSDISTYSNSFNNVVASNNRLSPEKKTQSKNVSCTETFYSTSELNATTKTLTSPSKSDLHSNKVDIEVSRSRNSVESIKSVGAETDSGILSDSIESNKLLHVEIDADMCPESVEYETGIVHNDLNPLPNSASPIELEEVSKIEKVSVKSGESEKLSETEIDVEPPVILEESVEAIAKEIESTSKSADINSFLQTSTTPNSLKDDIDKDSNEVPETVLDSSLDNLNTRQTQCLNKVRSGKTITANMLKERKKCGNRQVLLKKLKNLKRSSKVLSTSKDNHDKKTYLFEDVSLSENGEHTNNNDDYIPKKKPRIAHVPKTVTSEQNELTVDSNGRLNDSGIRSPQQKLCTTFNVSSEENTVITKEQPTSRHGELNNLRKASLNLQTITMRIRASEPKNDEMQKTHSSYSNIHESAMTNKEPVNNTEKLQPFFINPVSPEPVIKKTNKAVGKCTAKSLPQEYQINKIAFVKSKDEKVPKETKTELNNPHKNMENMITEIDSETITNTNTQIQSSRICIDYNETKTNEGSVSDEIVSGCAFHETSQKESVSVSSLESSLSNSIQEENETTAASENNIDVYNDSNVSSIEEEQTHINEIDDPEDTDKREPSSNVDRIYANGITERATRSRSKSKSESVDNIVNTKEETVQKDTPLFRLTQYANENKKLTKAMKKQYKKLPGIRLMTDKFVNKQLQRLVDNTWDSSLHWDIIEKLKMIPSARIIAKCSVDFLSTEKLCNEPLDKSYTPPAPLMTSIQQKFVTLLFDLEKSHPMISQFVQAGIEYKLFRLNKSLERSVVESLSRIYTVLARIQKDREKVRIFCCDAVYCLGLYAISVLYTVFTCWPEVFPNSGRNNELLPRCIAHIITSQQANDFPKLNAIKNLMSLFYEYPAGGITKELLKELLTAFQENSHKSVDTAIILLAKREGTSWTYKNIIMDALFPMIINNKHPSMYRAFSLLGNIMRAFPIDDKDNFVGKIVEQLCDLINSGEGSEEQQEGIISALLSLSRHKFNNVALSVINWTPTKPLYPRTIEQLDGFIKMRNPDFWKGYLKKCKQNTKN